MVEGRVSKEVEEIMSHIRQGHNFLLSGGAGSGKTYSLVEVIREIGKEYPTQRIACITYTNSASAEIISRTHMSNLSVSTIHEFLWDNISVFPLEVKKTLVELVNNEVYPFEKPDETDMFELPENVNVQYREYTRLKTGQISHNEVLHLSNTMFGKYAKLRKILKDKYPFILVDEYQDTSPLVIEILLKHLQMEDTNSNIIGFFGDSMQSIYDGSIGSIISTGSTNKKGFEYYVSEGVVKEVVKKQNRRNPYKVIQLANKLRTDGIVQMPSNDVNAPNMLDGKVKEGTVKFLYSENFDVKVVKNSQYCAEWDFCDSTKTKELRLTHNLIAEEGGFNQLFNIYDKDPIYKFIDSFKSAAKEKGYMIDSNLSFSEVVRGMDWKYSMKGKHHKGEQHLDVELEKQDFRELYDYIKSWPYEKLSQMNINKDNLIDSGEDISGREGKQDYLIRHLLKIQKIIYLYTNKLFNELLQKTQIKIIRNADKIRLKENIEKLLEMKNSPIGNVIDFADEIGLCIKDDRFLEFVEKNDYLYWRVKQIPYSEISNLYDYLEGYTPLSTQHKIKGLEFENVLVILHNGYWNKYNFEYLFDKNIFERLTPSKKNTYHSILERTKKLFYVCCTRARDNLVVYYPNPTKEVIEGAKELFGEENCKGLDKI